MPLPNCCQKSQKKQQQEGAASEMAAAAAAAAQEGMDARGWDEAAYRRGILRERDLSCRTLFRAVFFDHHDDPSDPDVLLAAASSDGSLASFSLSSCISSSSHPTKQTPDAAVSLVDPVCIVQAHGGPAYDVKFYPDSQQPLLFRLIAVLLLLLVFSVTVFVQVI